MTDRTSGDKAGEKSFFARTAKNTQKKAKRAQEKVKRKLGKSDETKDEFFDRFVENFNKQQDAVQSLQKELKNYINCIKAMLNANQLFSEAVKQVYEPEWSGRETFVDLLDVLDKNWNNLVQKLQDEVLEPLTSYQMQFPDTKNRISKRSRKVVDYDRHRHHLETLKVKGGKAVDPKKLSQSEEDYNQAKTVYLQLHSDLYEELPALYDSRISFYVSSFQSIFTAEGVFHQQTAKMKTQMSDLLDVLAKETSAGAYSTRRPVSVISNASSDGENSPFENFSKFEQTDNFSKFDHTDNSENAQSENEEVDAGAIDLNLPEQSTTDVDAGAIDLNLPEQSTTDVNDNPDEPHSDHSSPNLEEKRQALPSPPSPPPPPPTVLEEPVESPPSPNTVVDNEEENEETPVVDTSDTLETAEDPKNVTQGNEQEKGPEEEKGSEEEKASDVEHESSVLYKVVATHPYTGEDEDELTFEKGEVIHVVSYDDSDDPDDGWLMGVMQSTGVRGVFPGNFTKMMDSEEPS